MKMTIHHNTILGVACVVAALGMSSASAEFLVNESSGSTEIYNSSGTHTGTFASGLSIPVGIAEGGGFVFIGEYGTGKTLKYSTGGAALGFVNNGANAGWGPAGLAFTNGRIQSSLNSLGYVTSSAPDAGTEDENPFTPSGYMYAAVADAWNNGSPSGMTSLAPNGYADYVAFTTVNGDGSGALNYWGPGVGYGTYITLEAGAGARGVVAAGSSTFYVALFDAGKVVKVYWDANPETGGWKQSDWLTGLNTPVGLAIDGGILYVGSYLDKTITGYSLADASLQSSFSTAANPQYFALVSLTAEPVLPKLRMVGAGGGSATLQLDAAANVAYTVEYSTTLAAGSWGLLQAVPAGLERIETITDTNATDPKRFYRASVAP
jgi:hypothetical protein